MRIHSYFILASLLVLQCVVAQQAPIYLNCGGPNYTDQNTGIFWQQDTAYVNTGMTTYTGESIFSTNNPRLYQTKRWDPWVDEEMKYEIPCMNGEYYILLHFAETQSAIARQGQRLFDVYMENVQVLDLVDVYHEAGDQKRTAVVKKTAAAVQDGSLSIEFRRNVSNPIISGIEMYYLPPLQTLSRGEEDMRYTEDVWFQVHEDQEYTGRHECSFVQAGDKFYLFGGRENATQLEIYDYERDVWSIGAPAPLPFNHFQAVEYQGLIWVIGSFRRNGFPNEEPTEHVHVYDPAYNVWMQGPAISRPRGGGGLVVHDEKFYLVGGITMGHKGGHVAWLDEYNPWTGVWQQLDDAPNERDHFHAVVMNDMLYAAGGRRTSRQSLFNDTVAQVDVYNFTEGAWLTTNLPDLPIPRAGTTSVAFDGKLLVIGGESDIQEEAHDEVHALDPITGTWESLAPLTFGRHGMQAIVSGESIYVTAGSPNRGGGRQKRMEVYNGKFAVGQESVAGSIFGESVHIGPGTSEIVTIQHDGSGNQGVFVTLVKISGQDANDFEITGQSSQAPFLIGKNRPVFFRIENKGSTNYAQAWLSLEHSGGRWLSIPLGVEPPTSTSTPVTTTPPPPTNLDIKGLILVDAAENRDIYPVYICEYQECVNSTTSISVRAELYEESTEIDRVKLTIQIAPFINTYLHTQTERYAPYSLFGDNGVKYNGRQLKPGKYTVTAQAFSINGQEGTIHEEVFVIRS